MPRTHRSRTFISFANWKYSKILNKSTKFRYYDDYACWLFFKVCKEDYEKYYIMAEEDWRDYSNLQTGEEID